MHQHQAESGISDFLQVGVGPLNHLPEWGRSYIKFHGNKMCSRSVHQGKIIASLLSFLQTFKIK